MFNVSGTAVGGGRRRKRAYSDGVDAGGGRPRISLRRGRAAVYDTGVTRSTTHIRASEREAIIASASKDAQNEIRKAKALFTARVRSLERALVRSKQRAKDRGACLARDKDVLEQRWRRARRTADGRARKIEELKNMLKLASEINEPLVGVVCDYIREGLTVRAACRLAHVKHATLEKLLSEARAQGDRASDFAQHVLASIEEALGHNEKLWVDKARSAMDDDVVALGEGATFKKGDGKLAMMMLERQHSKDYSPRHVVVAEDNRDADDLSDLSDADLATKRAYEDMLERRARMGGGRAMAGFLPPPNNSRPDEPIPVDAELVGE